MREERVGITAVGVHHPAHVVTSEQVEERIRAAGGLRLPPGAVQAVTGIRSRRYLPDTEYSSSLAVAGARDLFARSGVNPLTVDLLVFASAGRDMVEPATAHVVQDELGTDAHCFDLTNACNSFVNGVDVARTMVLAGRAERALVVTGEAPSRSIRWDLADVAALREHFAGFTFGDAGAAVLVERVDTGGIAYVAAGAHSRHWRAGGIFGGGSRHPRDEEWAYFRGDGSALKEVFEAIGDGALRETLLKSDRTFDDFARVLIHQVTNTYLDEFVAVTGIPPEKVVRLVDTHGNLASASLPAQLASVWDELAPGDEVLFVGLGGGVSITTMVWQR